jgi:hypothetical protein
MKQSTGNTIVITTCIIITSIVFVISFGKQYIRFNGLEHFNSDGCSLFPDTLGESNYRSCCYTHDQAYYTGGSRNDRAVADKALYRCVANTSSNFIASVMYIGVRIGGSPYLPTSFRWNFSKDYGNFYSADD